MKMWLSFQLTLLRQSNVHSETEKKKCFMEPLREQIHSVKEAEISHENMTEEGLKSRLSSDNPCTLTFSMASIFR